MNKHFEDAWYYLTRASEHARLGLEEQLEPVTTKFRELSGHEPEPEPDRLEALLADARGRDRVGFSKGRLKLDRQVPSNAGW
ncbi:DUF7553 family protein [Natrialbaceae archaeon AArc-T1-2]|uniref:DUF7553 family protein n=1 Tax=Natrialbaceae archaeon AArc-T1-2 TaxID=3053904 RepID=UPI00255B09D0|nr:hypothetical protein [Natrialbaceae archaeon AArc-T1-2]WIV66554.1 hypothetical protein QQ977_12750 [Natrialbaceae archaeon AArc-T1-2]